MTSPDRDPLRPDDAGTAGPSSRAQAKAERRQQLIDATIMSISQHGLSGTTLAKVSMIAGTSVGLANFHFESKENLFEETLRHLARQQRDVWKAHVTQPGRSAADRLLAIVDSQFDPRICDRRKLSIWFAFWGDAGAREIYRRAVADIDDERLRATVDCLTALSAETGNTTLDPMQTALGLEALFDGLWLNMLLYPVEFGRVESRARALVQLAALFPTAFPALADPGRTDAA